MVRRCKPKTANSMEPTLKRTKTKTADEALRSLMNLCARRERASSDARRLMRKWGVSDADAEKVLARLVKERFIDDKRYAEAFVRDKLNLNVWGTRKIGAALRAKGIAADIVTHALEQAPSDNMGERLHKLILHKALSVKAKSVFDKRVKLMRYALSQGYEFEMARDCIDSIVTNEE